MLKDEFLDHLSFFNASVPYLSFFASARIINLNDEEWQDFSFLVAELGKHNLESAYKYNLIAAFFTKLARTFFKNETIFKKQDTFILQVVAAVNAHYKNRWITKNYADFFCMSSSAFRKKLAKTCRKTVIELQNERLIQEARKLLFRNQYTIYEIAVDLGFNETSHFSNWFKKCVGLAPSAYSIKDQL